MTKAKETLLVGKFRFDAENEDLIAPDGTKVALRPQTARVLGILAAEHGELVPKDRLMHEVWSDTHVTDDSLVQCISEIRRALGPEDAKLLATVPKQGYRLTAVPVSAARQPDPTRRDMRRDRSRRRGPLRMIVLAAIAATLMLAAGVIGYVVSRDEAPLEPVMIAVLPFDNLSGDPEQDYLSSGLAEDLLTDLSRIGDLKVLSRTTTFGLRNAPEAVAETIQGFGATHLVDGSVQREGGQIRISVQLVQLSTGANVWAQRYDRQLGDLFEIQDDLRSRIVEALAVRLAPQEQERLLTAGTADVSAYDLLLQGRYHEASLDRQGVTRAIVLYRRALDVDPGYTEAYARLANMYDFSSRFGWGQNPAADRVLALDMAERAVRLDPENPFAHWTLGRILSRLGRTASSRERAMQELRTAIEIDPNYADAYAFIALIYTGAGQVEEARNAISMAFDLNQTPQSWYYQNRGILSYFEEDYEAAEKDFLIAVDKNPTSAFSRLWLAAAYAMTGETSAAEWEIEEAHALGEPRSVADVLKANTVIHDPEFKAAYASGLAKAGLPE